MVIAAFAFLGMQVNALSTEVDAQEDELSTRVTELTSQNQELRTETSDLQAQLETVGTTTGVERMKNQLAQLRTCFSETLEAVQQASVEGYVSDFQSGEIGGWLDLGRFSSDCEKFLPDFEQGD